MYKTDISQPNSQYEAQSNDNHKKLFSREHGLKRSFNSINSNPRRKESRQSEDPIFNRLCPKEDYKNEPVCSICQMKFGMLSKLTKKNCQFCGQTVCAQHIKRTRQDPQNVKEYAKICDACTFKYLQRRLRDEHQASMRPKQ